MQEVKYAEVYYREYCDVLTKNFRTYLEKDLYIDLIFVCKFNRRIGAHQLVLGSFSTLLHKLFSDHQNHFKGHVVYVYVPDIRPRSMNSVLKFIYYGKVSLRTKEELHNLYEDLDLLDLPSHVVTSESESFCSYISGIRNLKSTQKATELRKNSVSIQNSSNMENGGNVVLLVSDNSPYVDSSEENRPSSSSLPVISSVVSMEPSMFDNANGENNTEVAELQLPETEPTSATDSPADTSVPPCNSTIDVATLNRNQSNPSKNTSTNDNSNLMRVLKNVAIACQDLETVGVSDDENIRRHLQSSVRIVKHCIVDINELLSTDVISTSVSKRCNTFLEKDWELKIMLENCLEKLPRLERTIENSSGRPRRRRKYGKGATDEMYLLHKCSRNKGCE